MKQAIFETYNRDNVKLVDGAQTPIVRVTPTGIETSTDAFEFDVIVYATGFDAFTGAFDQIDIRGTNGSRLRDKWQQAPSPILAQRLAGSRTFLC